MKIMNILHSSSVDGVGFRDVVFVAGCGHHCKGCHNAQSWNIENGTDMTVNEIYDDLMQSSLTNVTFSGGEPFDQCDELIELSKLLNGKKTIWIYSGYTYEEIITDPNKSELLEYGEVLVDGRFIEDLKLLNGRFKGSSNQRIIDLNKTRDNNEVVLWDDGNF